MSSENNKILYNRFTKGKKEKIEMDDDEFLCPNCGEVIIDFEIQVSREITQYGSYIGEISGGVHDYETEDEEQHSPTSVNKIMCCRCGHEIFDPLYSILLERVQDNI